MIFNVPTTLVANGIIRIPMLSEFYITDVGASLRALTSGSFTVRARNTLTNEILGSVVFTVSGVQEFPGLLIYMAPQDGLSIDVTSIGVGALDCYFVVWGYIP